MRSTLALAVALAAVVAAVAARPGDGKPVAGAVTIAWGGDTVLGSTYGLPPEEGRSLLVHVAPLFRAADIGFVNLEEALSNGSAAKCAAGSTNCFAGSASAFAF